MGGIRRREFIGLLGGAAAAWPIAARAQQPAGGIKHLGVLMAFGADDPELKAYLTGFRQGLEKRGWLEGRNLLVDYRLGVVAVGQMAARAKELISLQPDVVFTQGVVSTAALQHESSTVPIVFVQVTDPIDAGFIASAARPGGNITGLVSFEAGIASKWFQMLKEIEPSVSRAALLMSPTNTFKHYLNEAEAAASALNIELKYTPVEDTIADIVRAIESFAALPDGGLILPPDLKTMQHRDLILALAARYRLPAVYGDRIFVNDGGLASYGADIVAMFRQAAGYVDRILRGDKPADLPVQAPVKYETVLNLKTAKALGLNLPPVILLRADEVIE
jgi:putative ABC transport system substrate-binding protein